MSASTLTWVPTSTGYAADGETSSYRVDWDGKRWVVRRLRQDDGTVTRRSELLSMDGAFARARLWEMVG